MTPKLKLPLCRQYNSLLIAILSMAFVYLPNANSYAQQIAQNQIYFTLDEVALLDIEPNTENISLLPSNTTLEAGESPFQQVMDNSKWLNYSSAVAATGNSRQINAQIMNGSLPLGVILSLTVSNCTTGGGTRGNSVGSINLNTNPQTIITGIRGAYTGDGANNGHQLEYRLQIDDISQIEAGSTSLTIMYTITQ